MHPQTTPRIRVPAPLHAPLSTRLLEISLSLAVSKRSIFWPVWPPGAPRGPLQPSQIQKIVGAGAFPPLHPPSAAARRVRRCAAHGLGCAQPAVQRPFRSQTPIQRPFRPKMPISFICAVVPPLISGLLHGACIRQGTKARRGAVVKVRPEYRELLSAPSLGVGVKKKT